MVLVESSVPRQLDETPGFRESWEAEMRDLPRQYMWERLRVWTGWERLMGRCHNRPAKELESLSTDELARLVGLYNAKTCRPEYVGGELGELIAFEVSATQAGRLNSWLAALSIGLTAIYAMGVIIRAERPTRLGPDSILALVLYAIGIVGLVYLAH